VATELEVEAASCESEFACGAGDVAVVLLEGFGSVSIRKRRINAKVWEDGSTLPTQ
jgi:hypothetical protein